MTQPTRSESTPDPFDENTDFSDPLIQAAATTYYAGPFCSCRDYSCPAMNDPSAQCVNRDR